jgi:alcohol dehydrogenase class IV
MEFRFFAPANVVSGTGCVVEQSHLMRALGARALVITGKHSASKSGALDDVLAAFKKENITYAIYDEIRENPLLSSCRQAGLMARSEGADFIVGIGGGSVLDAARAASVFARCDFAQDADIFKNEYTRHMPFVLVGTTAGTGSEIDNISVLTQDGTGKKAAISKASLFADVTFCDYNYTKTMNLRQTVSTGLDALCHCFESWFNQTAGEASATFARRGVELIYPHLADIAAGNFDANCDALRRDLYYGSLWGGLAIAHTGTGFPHPAGYILTEQGHFPHGFCCAVYEPDFLEVSLPHVDSATLDQLFAVIDSLDDLYETLERLTQNDITLSKQACIDTADRMVASANMRKTLGGFRPDEALPLVEHLFLRDTQTVPVEGGWLFGKP